MESIIDIEAPILTPYYDIITWILIIEFIAVILIGGLGLSLQGILSRRKKKKARTRGALKSTLLQMIDEKKHFTLSKFPSRLLDLSAMLAAIIEIDDQSPPPHWEVIKKEIQEQYLLPQARQYAKSPRWTQKLNAARCFALSPKAEDEQTIVHLLQHKVPIIKSVSSHAAVTIGSETSLDAILSTMNKSTHYLRHPFHDALSKGGDKIFTYLEKRLESETNPYTRVSCIEVLMNQMNDHILSLIEKDLHAEHKNLKIAAIRALGHFKSERSIQLLLPLLNDLEWEVRATAARSLGYLEAKQALQPLSDLCRDTTWWVRMNSALALKRLGKEGEQLLREQKPEVDRYAYEIAQYALSVHEE